MSATNTHTRSLRDVPHDIAHARNCSLTQLWQSCLLQDWWSVILFTADVEILSFYITGKRYKCLAYSIDQFLMYLQPYWRKLHCRGTDVLTSVQFSLALWLNCELCKKKKKRDYYTKCDRLFVNVIKTQRRLLWEGIILTAVSAYLWSILWLLNVSLQTFR